MPRKPCGSSRRSYCPVAEVIRYGWAAFLASAGILWLLTSCHFAPWGSTVSPGSSLSPMDPSSPRRAWVSSLTPHVLLWDHSGSQRSEVETVPATFFGQALAELREAKGLSKYEVVKSSGLDKALYKRIESGDRLPTDDALRKLAPAFGMSFQEMKALTVDDVLGPDDYEVLFDWFQQEAQDRERRQTKAFWEGLDALEFDRQVARLYRDYRYAVSMCLDHVTGSSRIVLEKDGLRTLVLTRVGGDKINQEDVLQLAAERIFQKMDEAIIIATAGFDSEAVAVAKRQLIGLNGIDDLVRLQAVAIGMKIAT